MIIYATDVAAQMKRNALKKTTLFALLDRSIGEEIGIVSAYKTGESDDDPDRLPKSQNKSRHGKLLRDIQMLGLRAEPLSGEFRGAEKSVMVPGMTAEETFALGRKYDQVSVIHKSRDNIAVYYDFRSKTAAVAIDLKNTEIAFEWSTRPDLISKARGLSFEFGFIWEAEIPWDGRTPLSRARIEDLLSNGYFERAIERANG